MSQFMHVIEDDDLWLNWIKRLLTKRSDLALLNGLPEIEVIATQHASGARDLIEQDLVAGRPRGLVLLDLCIPSGENDPPNAANGFQLLEEYREAGYEVIVFSQYGTVDHLTELVNQNAAGFVAKATWPDESCELALVAVVASHLKRVIEKRKARWDECRHRFNDWQIGQTYLQLANQLVATVDNRLASLTQTEQVAVSATPSQMAMEASRDSRLLHEVAQEIRRIRNEHLGLADLQTADARKPVDLGEVVREILRKLDSGIHYRQLQVEVHSPSHASMTFELFRRPVEFLLSGLLFYAIDVSPAGGTITIDIKKDDEGGGEMRLVVPFVLDADSVGVLKGVQDAILPDDSLWRLRIIRRVLQSTAGRLRVQMKELCTEIRVEIPGFSHGPTAASRVR